MRKFFSRYQAIPCISLILLFALDIQVYTQSGPVISGLDDQIIFEGNTFAAIDLDGVVADPDNTDEELTWNFNNNVDLQVNITNHTAFIEVPDNDWYGEETILFTVSDPDLNQSSDEATFTVVPVNDAPIISDIPGQTIPEGGSFSVFDLDPYVTDIDDDPASLTWTASEGTNLLASIDGSNNTTISINNAGWTGSESIMFSVKDPSGAQADDDALFIITDVESNPIAGDNSYTLDEGNTLSTPAPGVLSNDSDADGDPLSAVLVTDPEHSTSFNLDADGSFVYTHDGSNTTGDAFTYVADDGKGQSNVATVNLTVNAVNDSPVITPIPPQTVEKGTNFNPIDLDNYVSDEEDPDNLLAWASTGSSELDVLIDDNTHVATIVKPQKNWVGSETITFIVTDTEDDTDSETTTFTTTELAEAPVANPDEYDVNEGATLNVSAPGVLENDTDGDGDPLTAQLEDGPDFATSFVLNPDGSFSYTHDGSETTEDSFTYHANDGTGNSNTVTVTITINPQNDPPVAINDAYSVAEGGTLNQNAAGGVLNNDTDPENNTLTAVKVTDPANGSLTLNSNGSFTYVHNGSETTTDQFTYRANDGTANSNISTVNITITGDNDPPVAVNDAYTVAEGGTLNQNAAGGVLNNDTDPESNPLTAIKVTDPANGSLTLNTNGSFTYIHNGSETTTDQFTYRANDGTNNSNVATVIITVTPQNDPPVAVNDAYSVAEGGTLNQNAAGGVLNNDTDPENNTLTAVKVTDPANGSLTLNSNGSFTYVHNGSETTTDQFTYRANDGTANSNIATVNITITGDNDPPVAVNDAYTVAEGGTLNRNAAGGVLNNDTDPESNPLTAIKVTDPANGSLTLNTNGSFTYIHNGSETTTDQFTYRANDGTNNSNVATVNITITPQNDPPVAVNDAYSVAEGGTLNQNAAGGVLSNDTDPENNTLTAVKVTDPANGSLTLNPNGSFIYVHNGSETTTDQFTYRANDGTANSNIATVNITITGDNDPPVAVNDAYTIAEGGTLNRNAAGGVLNNDTDPESNPLTAIKVTDPANGSLTLNTNGSFIYIHNGSETTTDQFTYRANDGTNNSNVATVNITITPQNDPPVVSDIPNQTVTEGSTFATINLDAFVTDPDHPDNQITWTVSGSTQLTVTISPARVATINIPSTDWNGSETITFRATDPLLAFNSDPATFTVTPENDPPVASDLTITASNNYIGTPHTGSFTFTDPDGDGEGAHTYKWYRSTSSTPASPVPISGAASNIYTPVQADGGNYIGFEVTPVDEGGLAGSTVRINPFRYINDAPEAQNPQVNAPQSIPGSTISGVFTYFDKENNTAGTAIYRWYRRDNNSREYGLPGTQIGTEPTYLLRSADAGKFIWFKIIPVATAGSSPGDSAWSNIIGPIGQYTASIAGSDTFCQGATMSISLTITGGNAPYQATLRRTGTLPKDTTITNIMNSSLNINVKIPGSYTLRTVSDGSGDLADVSAAVPVLLVINPRPRAVISGSTSICEGVDTHAQLSLDFVSGVGPWNVTIRRTAISTKDSTISGITQDPYSLTVPIFEIDTRYRVVAITDANGCPGDTTSGSAWLRYKSSPIATISGTDSICAGETAMITIRLTSPDPLISPWSFSYQRNGAHAGTFTNINTQVQTIPVTLTGVYTLSVVSDQSGTGCGSGQATITAHIPPTATISGTATICEHTTANLSINLTGKAPWKFAYHRNILHDSTVVENIFTSPRIVQAGKPGTYRLYEVMDRNGCRGTFSGNAIITVTPSPDVTISGLGIAYNFENNEIDTIIGTPSGGEYSGPGVIGNFFLPRIAGLGTHNITYRYRTSPGTCWGYDTAVVNVLESNAIILFDALRTKYCRNDAAFNVTGVNLADYTGSFTISGGTGLQDNGNNTATVNPKLLTPNKYTITYTYEIEGESFFERADFDIGPEPLAQFSWATECFHAGQPVSFLNKSTSSFGFLTDTSYIWKINTNTGFDADSSKDITYTFPEAGIYRMEMQITNSYGCSDTSIRYFNLRPTFDLKDRYSESFDLNPISWQPNSETPVNSWKLGNPSKHEFPLRGFSGAYSDTSCWYTKITKTPGPLENSWVTSPCFDFSDTDRPMLSVQIWRLFNSNRDGANVQATADSGKTWNLVGELGDGENWFNTSYIRGEPGGKDNGWSNYDGVSNDAFWVRARHGLDYLKGKKDVQFRIAYGSDGTPQNNDGIAFDNFIISERTKMALIEHFTNTGLNSAEKADSIIDLFAGEHGMHAVDIQYHTSTPSGDPFYEDNPMVPTSRLFYYGLATVPYAVIDGGAINRHNIDFDPESRPFDKNTIIRQSLTDSKFQILVNADRAGNKLNALVTLVPNEFVPLVELSVRTVVVESIIQGVSGSNGDTIFRNIVRTMLPDAAGITRYKSWDPAEVDKLEYTWDIENVNSVERLMVVAFIQNEATREIYNVDVDTVGLLTGSYDPLPVAGRTAFSVYPNPAHQQAIVKLDDVSKLDVTLELFNNTGSLVYSTRIPAGEISVFIPAGEFPDGLYVLRLLTKNKLLGIRKLIVTK